MKIKVKLTTVESHKQGNLKYEVYKPNKNAKNISISLMIKLDI